MSLISRDCLSWAIEHLARHPDTDIFPKGFEFEAMAHCRDDVIAYFDAHTLVQWDVRALRKCLTPKQRYGFRVATQLDPIDILAYTALMLELGEVIEDSRVPASMGVVFSSRFRPDEDYFVFDRSLGYPEFQVRSRELADRSAYVVLTDIADFYPRIYFHRLENALRAKAPSHTDHVRAILRLIKGWNQNVSYGIPVGNNPSRLLAEIVIDDLDRALLAEGFTFARYIDDSRLFCATSEEAYRALARLANLLFEMHGLTLQAQKTDILPTDRFVSEVLESDERKQRQSIADHFEAVLSHLGVDDPYGLLEYEDLPTGLKEAVDELNLVALLEAEVAKEEPDLPMLRLLVNRLGWLKCAEPLWLLLEKIDHLHPVCAEIVPYIAHVGPSLPEDTRHHVGALLLAKMDGSLVGQLEYNGMLIMGLFAGSNAWGNADNLAKFYVASSDDWLRRSVLLALGKSSQDFWLRANKSQLDSMSPWEKRAFLYAASCFPADEMKHWYNAVWSRLDPLERWVVTWAKAKPICA